MVHLQSILHCQKEAAQDNPEMVIESATPKPMVAQAFSQKGSRFSDSSQVAKGKTELAFYIE